MMTEEFEILTDIFQCSAHGKEYINTENINLKEIKELANKQGVWFIIFNNYKKIFLKYHQDKIAASYIENEENTVVANVCRDISRKETLKCILNDCKKKNIQCAVLKGYIFSQLYAEPDYRISGDIDLLVNEEDEGEMVGILENYGYTCSARLNSEYHRECLNDCQGLIELHVSLYDSYCKDIWFRGIDLNVSEPCINITTIDGYEYATLGYTDNYIYIVLHFIKHFISGGVGLRQLMDVMLFTSTYKKNINIEQYVSVIKKLNFDVLMDIVSEISVKYLGFDRDDLIFCGNDVSCSSLIYETMEIMETGGLFGRYSESSEDFSKKYTEICLERTGENYRAYLRDNIKRNGYIKSVFVSSEQLSSKYYYAKKRKILLPIAWIHRIVNAVYFGYNKKNNNIYANKLNYLKKLKVIEDENQIKKRGNNK